MWSHHSSCLHRPRSDRKLCPRMKNASSRIRFVSSRFPHKAAAHSKHTMNERRSRGIVITFISVYKPCCHLSLSFSSFGIYQLTLLPFRKPLFFGKQSSRRRWRGKNEAFWKMSCDYCNWKQFSSPFAGVFGLFIRSKWCFESWRRNSYVWNAKPEGMLDMKC